MVEFKLILFFEPKREWRLYDPSGDYTGIAEDLSNLQSKAAFMLNNYGGHLTRLAKRAGFLDKTAAPNPGELA